MIVLCVDIIHALHDCERNEKNCTCIDDFKYPLFRMIPIVQEPVGSDSGSLPHKSRTVVHIFHSFITGTIAKRILPVFLVHKIDTITGIRSCHMLRICR